MVQRLTYAILPLFLSAFTIIFNPFIYPYEFRTHNVYAEFPEADIDAYNSKMLSYLRGEGEFPLEIAMNEREISHMQDVKSIFVYSILAFFILTLMAIFFSMNKKLPLILYQAGIMGIGLGVILAVFFGFFFEASFSLFHSLFFEDGSWLFLEGDNLIRLYPAGLFFDIALRTFLLYFTICFLMAIYGYAKYREDRVFLRRVL